MNNTSSATHKRVQPSTTLNRKYVKRPAAKAAATTYAEKTAQKPAARPAASRATMNSSIKSTSPSARSAQIAEANRAAATLRAETMARRAALAEQMNRERLAKMRQNPAPRPAMSSAKSTKTSAEASAKSASTPVVGTNMGAPLSAPASAQKSTKKNAAMASAMRSVAAMDTTSQKKLRPSRTFTMKRVALAFACSAIIVGGLFYFIKFTTPDLNLSVAAMQVGFDVNPRFFTPRDYSMTSVVSETGKLTMTFTTKEGSSYTITEELSAWDSATLEKNYVKETFTDYVKAEEQGLTLFISGSSCAWVNGGKLFTIQTANGTLSNKQLKAIAASL